MEQSKFSVKDRVSSFRNALNGIKAVISNEHNAWIQLGVCVCIIIAGALFKITAGEWIAIIVVSGLVFSLEAINTSIEKLTDFISPEKHEAIRKVKDISAAGVLIGSVTAVVIGLIIFLPKIIKLI
jgi:diacylglycerol kinase